MTVWQDWAIFLGQVILCATLIPTIRQKIAMPLSTCIPAAVILSGFTFVFATLHLPISAASSLANAIAWGWITYNSSVLRRGR